MIETEVKEHINLHEFTDEQLAEKKKQIGDAIKAQIIQAANEAIAENKGKIEIEFVLKEEDVHETEAPLNFLQQKLDREMYDIADRLPFPAFIELKSKVDTVNLLMAIALNAAIDKKPERVAMAVTQLENQVFPDILKFLAEGISTITNHEDCENCKNESTNKEEKLNESK